MIPAPHTRPMSLDVLESPEAVVVTVRGSVDMSDTETLRARLDEVIAARPSLLVLELSEMEFISSAGLGAIVSAQVQARAHDGRVRLVAPKPEIRRLLETTRLDAVLVICSTLEEAMAE